MDPSANTTAGDGDDDEAASGPPTRPNRHDRLEVLIMSEAGKLIYSHSKREDAITLVPLCTALINYAQKTQNETLNFMRTSNNLVINFTVRPPLIIVVIHEENSYVDSLVLVEQVEAQVISILTARTLKSVFYDRPTFDLKRLLYGSEKLIDSILNLCVTTKNSEWPLVQSFLAVSPSTNQSSISAGGILTSPTPALPARPHRILVPVSLMLSGMRETLHSFLINVVSNVSKNMVFSLLFKLTSDPRDEEHVAEDGEQAGSSDFKTDVEQSDGINFELISVCNHHPNHKLKIADIHIILALLNGSKAQLVSAESLWIPVCLPRFNQDAFLHSYISFTNDSHNCLVLMSTDRDEFSSCKKVRDSVEEKLENIYKEPNQKQKIHYQLTPLVHPVLLEIQEKLTSDGLTEEELVEVQQRTQIYNSKFDLYHARQLQFLWYQTSKQVLWWQRSSRKSMSPVIYYITRKMLQSALKILWIKLHDNSIFLGWHVPTFQLYAQFDNTITTNEATEVVQKITNWIKKEEDNFSVKDYR